MVLSLFIGCKQISDMIYQVPWFDYGILLWAIIMFAYRFIKQKEYINLWKKLCFADYMVIFLGVLFFISFLRDTSFFKTLVQIESCFLLFFLGKMCKKEEIDKHGRLLAIIGYVIIYANLAYRFYLFGFKFWLSPGEEGLLNTGGLYYYKTDLAVGIIYAMLFVYLYSKNNWLKWFTVFVSCGYIILYSKARTEQPLLIMIWLIMIYTTVMKKTTDAKKIKSVIAWGGGIVFCLLTAFFVGVQTLPLDEIQSHMGKFGEVLESIFHSRHIIWLDVLSYLKQMPFATRLLGVDLGTEVLRTTTNMRLHSHYMKMFYSVGYLGSYLFTVFLYKVFLMECERNSEKRDFLFWTTWLIFLVAGISTESIMFTQLSWMPMLFTGIMVSGRKVERGNK